MSAAVEVRGLTKHFGSLTALDAVDISFHAGEIHAIVGENGAGKSTLVECIAGGIVPDAGSLSVGGKTIAFGDPIRMRRNGVRIVHQHFKLVPAFTVYENLLLAARARNSVEDALRLASEFGWRIDLDARISELPVGVQQRIELIKAICVSSRGGIKLLLLDEPTAVLSQEEVDDLFRVLRGLKEQGVAVALIAHKLSDFMQISDRITVLRGGRLVGTTDRQATTAEQIIEWMVGKLMDERLSEPEKIGPAIVEANNLRVRGDRGELAIKGVSFQIRQGEILGIGGVDGNGQIELAEALAGVRQIVGGELDIADDSRRRAYISQDRQRDGLALDFSLSDNFLIGHAHERRYRSHGLLSARTISIAAEKEFANYDVRYTTTSQLAGSLSGGNQQKIVLARELQNNAKFIIAVNPTRGLDLNATAFVRSKLIQQAQGGAAIALFSADRDELNEVAYRQLYLSSGKLSEGYLGAAS